MHRLATSSCLCAVLATAAPARADDGDDPPATVGGETIVIEGQAPGEPDRDRDRALGDAPFVTVLHPDDHAATASVADAIGTAAGAHTRSLGGLGAFESVSVRGASPGHTAVLVDGVPLARIAAVTVDLGRFAMSSFGEVELYRGAVPIELGGAGVGGAVNLVTRLGRGAHGERIRASIGGGSFGARHARLAYGDDHGAVVSSTTIGYQGATGDYSYFTDNGTPLNPSDDTTLVRANNQFDQVDGASRVGTKSGSIVGGARLMWKRQGLAGSTAQPALDANMETYDLIADARGETTLGRVAGRQVGFALVEHQTLDDPMAELGLGTQHRAYLTLSGGASSTWTAELRRVRATAGLELRGDRFRDHDASGDRADLVGTRGNAAIAAAADIAITGAIVVTPAVRLDVVRTAPTPMTEGPDAFADLPTRWDTVPSPRITGRALVTDDLAIKSSAGWYVRLPTLLELFGDRGVILGAPDLLPERGPSVDLGAVWAPAAAIGPLDRVFVEAAAFATRARDTIALVSYAGFVARAENVGDTRTYGGELVASARLWRTLSLTASYLRLATEQRADDPSFDGKALPRTPGHLLHARLEAARRIARRDVSAWLDGAAQSTAYLDRANFQTIPGRVLAGAGARVELVDQLGITLSVDNLGDTRIVELPAERPTDPVTRTALSDLAGFPLPGRSFYLSLDWTH
ncbi:MAG TPA: TonB-dependent receptor [Kofleriaceae bacterium]|nr:TonB-dependent receptor [Kofleriaceae bacterium]